MEKTALMLTFAEITILIITDDSDDYDAPDDDDDFDAGTLD